MRTAVSMSRVESKVVEGEKVSVSKVSKKLVRSSWPSARNYIGLRGGSDVDPYQFDESEDMAMGSYHPVLKKAKLKLGSNKISRSIIDDLVDFAVESAEESEKQLRDVFENLIESFSSEFVPATQMQDDVDVNLNDIFETVISKYGGPSELLDSAFEGVQMVQCLSCHKTSCNFTDLWDQNHNCQVDTSMTRNWASSEMSSNFLPK